MLTLVQRGAQGRAQDHAWLDAQLYAVIVVEVDAPITVPGTVADAEGDVQIAIS